MGVIATVAGGLAVLFPETLGRYLNGIFSTPIFFWTLDDFFCSRRLPESMEEALNIGKKKNYCQENSNKIGTTSFCISKVMLIAGKEGNSRGLLTCTCLSPAEMFRLTF